MVTRRGKSKQAARQTKEQTTERAAGGSPTTQATTAGPESSPTRAVDYGASQTCPECGRRTLRVTRTIGELRYMKCQRPSCGANVKGVGPRRLPSEVQ